MDKSDLPYIDSRYVVFADSAETLFRLRDFERESEHITLVDTYAFTLSPYPDCEPDGAEFYGWQGAPDEVRSDS